MIADVLLPLSLSQAYSFEVPAALQFYITTGMRVEVQFGKNRIYAGIVYKLYARGEDTRHLKPILSLLDDTRLMGDIHLQFWQWISDYYLCTMGEVMIGALPAAFKLSSNTLIAIHPHWPPDVSVLNDDEYLILEALQLQKKLSILEVQKIVQRQSVNYLIKGMLEKGVLIHWEELEEKYKPRIEKFVSLDPFYLNEENQRQLFDLVAKAPKQEALLLSFFTLGGHYREISQTELLKKSDTGPSVLQGLVEKKIFIVQIKAVDRLAMTYNEEAVSYSLSPLQIQAKTEIDAAFDTKNVALLHGITSSGKTQIYIELISEIIASGRTALFLMPEIALTTQMILRLRKVFKEKIGIYHSRFNDQERVEIWHKVNRGEYRVVLGPRSSVFLPFKDLGLIIIDEEHDPSYKQFETNPHYHARDAAIYLAHLFHAKVLMGTATPSFESFSNARSGKYGYIQLKERYGGVLPPEVMLTDLRKASKNKQLITHFTKELLDEIKKMLDHKRQIILFKNRRGFSPFVTCHACQSPCKCIHCDVLLTYHKFNNSLRCHYCGYSQPLTATCEHCHEPAMIILGFGTEKIEEEMQHLFPEAVVGRLDLDTAKKKTAYEKILNDFENQKINILVGTQIITKGLDFSNVGLVGIVSADQMLQRSDFRAPERAFQLMVQVSGRAGRLKEQGRVFIQTSEPLHWIFPFILQNDYLGFFESEMKEREKFGYPPYCRLINITLKHKNRSLINEAALFLAAQWRTQHALILLGPTAPPVSFIRLMHVRTLLIKYASTAAGISHTKSAIRQELELLKTHTKYKSVVALIDVDPYH